MISKSLDASKSVTARCAAARELHPEVELRVPSAKTNTAGRAQTRDRRLPSSRRLIARGHGAQCVGAQSEILRVGEGKHIEYVLIMTYDLLRIIYIFLGTIKYSHMAHLGYIQDARMGHMFIRQFSIQSA